MPARPASPVLARRTLNRTLLRRQALLERVDRPVLEVVEHLVGMQAQEPPDPYIGLWARIRGFDPAILSRMIEDRRAVRIGLMRTTLHLVSAADCRLLAPLTRDVHARAFRNTPFARALRGLDLDEVVVAATGALADGPLTPSDLGRRLAATWPDRDPGALAAVARYHLPLVQVPPRGQWARTGRATNTLAEAWLGAPLIPMAPAGVQTMIRRYLGAFGPASVADVRTWSGLTGLREVVEAMRPTLRTFRDEAGRELFDVPDAPLEGAETPAPVRFLPQFDNVFLSHADRSRINGDLPWGLDFGWKAPVLIDGVTAAAWRVGRAAGMATMTVEVGRTLARLERAELEAEAERVFDFVAGDAPRRELTLTIP